MATMNAAQLREIQAQVEAMYVREGLRLHADISKVDLTAALAAVDAWFDANAADLNASIPQPARARLTTAQKALALIAILRRRLGA